jgi:hypothetical protein
MALHPIGDEALAWITEVSTPLCTLFVVACLWQWLLFRQELHDKAHGPAVGSSPKLNHYHRWLHYSAAILFYLLALLSKPMAVFVPVMIWALDMWIVKVNWKRTLRDLWPWFLPAAGLSIWMKHIQPAPTDMWIPALWQRPLVAMDTIIFYLGKILAPHDFAIDYGRTPRWVLMQHGMLLLEIVTTILLAAGLWLLHRRRPIYICAAVLFIAGMGAVLGLTPFWFQTYSTVADRYAYLPLLGIAMVIAGLLAGVRNPLPWVLFTVAMLVCGALTFRQAQNWHDSYTLYAHTIEVNPNSWMAWDNTAYELIGDEQPERALLFARIAYAIDSTQIDMYSNMGMVLAMENDPRQAIPYFRRVMFAKVEDSITAMNLGAAYVQLHQYDLGIKWLRYAHQRNPTSKKVQWLLSGAIRMRDKLHPTTTTATQP